MNKEEKFESLKQKHISEGGTSPGAYAVTEMIKEAIENKTYRTYNGGGFYENGEAVEFYDIVVWFTWGHDPVFQMAGHHDLDSVELFMSNEKGVLCSKMM